MLSRRDASRGPAPAGVLCASSDMPFPGSMVSAVMATSLAEKPGGVSLGCQRVKTRSMDRDGHVLDAVDHLPRPERCGQLHRGRSLARVVGAHDADAGVVRGLHLDDHLRRVL